MSEFDNNTIKPSALMRSNSVAPAPLMRSNSVAPAHLMRSNSVAPPPLVRIESSVVQSAFSFADYNGSILDIDENADIDFFPPACDEDDLSGLSAPFHGECIYYNVLHDRINPDGDFCFAGSMTFSDGSIYTGEWTDAGFRGQGVFTTGELHHFAGRTYDGLWHIDNMQQPFCGSGSITLRDGSTYAGEWVNGDRQGNGTQTDAHGTIVYTGVWHHDEPQSHILHP